MRPSPVLAIARRELGGYFGSPIAYVVLAATAAYSAVSFLPGFTAGSPASLRTVCSDVAWLALLVAPALSMRLISEELRSGTFERLAATPVRSGQIVVGKWLAASVCYAGVLIGPVAAAVALEAHAAPEWGPMIAGMLAVLLAGWLYLAAGTFASALSRNQVIALLLAVFAIGAPTLALHALADAQWLGGPARRLVARLSVADQLAELQRGVLDLRTPLFFASTTALFLFLATLVVEGRRR
ncbi:MAG: ABC transporter permease [Planctomycetota bacterium]